MGNNGETRAEFERISCAINALAITNTVFKHKVAHECTWYQATLGQRLMINFVVMLSQLSPYVLHTRVREEQSHELIATLW